MNSYALTLVLRADLDEESRKKLLESITKSFSEMSKEDLWGSRDLAYPIKRHKKGWYAHYLFSVQPEAAPKLDKTLKLEEDVLRYLLVRV